jgi:hypothetical protein
MRFLPGTPGYIELHKRLDAARAQYCHLPPDDLEKKLLEVRDTYVRETIALYGKKNL